MEAMILDLDFALLNSQNLLKEYSKNLFVTTVIGHTQKVFLAGCGCYVLEGNMSGAHTALGTRSDNVEVTK